MEKVNFKDEWEEMCPIFIKEKNHYTHIGTGVLLSIWNKTYLLTVAHIVDFIYENNQELYIPSNEGNFIQIDGKLFHNSLVYNQNRADDKIDFSYFELSEQMVLNIIQIFKPLLEKQICLSTDFSFNTLTKEVRNDNRKRKSLVCNEIRERYKELNSLSEDEVKEYNDIAIKRRITFAGYPLNKTSKQSGIIKGEIVYYHGGAVNQSTYKEEALDENIHIISEFGRAGAYKDDIVFSDFTKPQGISGGGVYRIIRTDDGFDRELIGIGHTYLAKKHLFIGTNIRYCLDIIKNNRLMPYEVYNRLESMTKILAQKYIDESK